MTAVEQPERTAPASTDVDAVVVERGSGVVVHVSESLLEWSGREVDDLLGRPVWDSLAGEGLAEALREAHETGEFGVVEGPVLARDGSSRELRFAQVAVTVGESGQVVMTAVSGSHVDGDPAPAPAEDEVEDEAPAREGAEGPTVLDTVTRGLLETLSHELRTPVASVAGYAELLREGEGGQLTMMQRKFVAAIARSSERLRGLADQLLLIGGLESESTQLQLSTFDLREVVSSVRVSLAASGLERVNVTLLPGEEPLLVVGDRQRLLQAAEELVVNAAKFTLGSGEVSCSVRAEGDHAVIEVVDDGVGIAEDDAASLFLPFYRSRAVRVRGVPGAGLGLSFVSAVARGHDGEATATPRPSGGSVFAVRVPLAPPPEPEPEPESSRYDDLEPLPDFE